MSLSEEEEERYSRQIVLDDIGYKGQMRLRKSKFCVVGVGGLGTHIATSLTTMGAGLVRIVDRDIVELSNLHRQPLYGVSNLGYPKVEAAAARLQQLNPDVQVESIPSTINSSNAADIISDCDVVVDGLDSIEARYALNAACVKLEIPYVYGSAIESMGSAMTIIPNQTPCVQCVFPNLRDDELPKCGVDGVNPSILSLVSSIEVSEAVKIALGNSPSLAGRLLLVNLHDISFDIVDLKRADACRICGPSPDPELVIGNPKFVEDICGRDGGKRVFVLTPKENLGIEMSILAERIRNSGLNIKTQGALGITFQHSDRVSVSVLSSGVTIVVGANVEEEAIEIFRTSILEPLQIPWNRVSEVEPKLVNS